MAADHLSKLKIQGGSRLYQGHASASQLQRLYVSGDYKGRCGSVEFERCEFCSDPSQMLILKSPLLESQIGRRTGKRRTRSSIGKTAGADPTGRA